MEEASPHRAMEEASPRRAMEEAVTLARVLRGLLRLWPVRSAPHPHLCLRRSDIVAVHSPATTSLDKPPSCILRTLDFRDRGAWSSHDLARRPKAQPDLCSRLRATLCPANPNGVQQPPSALGLALSSLQFSLGRKCRTWPLPRNFN
jgi:hypothetical protein